MRKISQMNLGVSSRYAVLPDDDEGPCPKATLTPKPNASVNSANTQKKSQQMSKNISVKKNQEKNSRRGIDPDLQNLAFGMGRSKKFNGHTVSFAANTNHKPPVTINGGKKDGVDDKRRKEIEEEDLQFQKELEEVLLLSKLEYEQTQKNEIGSLSDSVNKKTTNCRKPELHLEEFGALNQLDINKKSSGGFLSDTASKFNESTTPEIKKELKLFECDPADRYKDWRNGPDGVILQLQKDVAERDNKIMRLLNRLTEELESNSVMKEELKILRESTALYSSTSNTVFEQQIEELTREKDELVEELGRLRILYEQEKSKNHVLQLQLRSQNSRKDSK